MPPKRYRVHWIPPNEYGLSFRVRSLFFVISAFSGSFSVELLCGREDRETARHPPVHLPSHLPTPRSAWSSRTKSGLGGNPCGTSSGVAGSAASSNVEAGSAASSAPCSGDAVDGIKPVVLQLPSRLKPRSAAATSALRQEEVDSWVLAVCEYIHPDHQRRKCCVLGQES